MGGEDLAKIADGYGRTLRFDQQAHGGGDLTAPGKQIQLLQVFKVRRQDFLVGKFCAHHIHCLNLLIGLTDPRIRVQSLGAALQWNRPGFHAKFQT